MTRKRRRRRRITVFSAAGASVLFLPAVASWSLFHIQPPRILRKALPPVSSQPKQSLAEQNSDETHKIVPADDSSSPIDNKVAAEGNDEEGGIPGIGAFEMDAPNVTRHSAVPPPRSKSKQPQHLFFFPSQSKPQSDTKKQQTTRSTSQTAGLHKADDWMKRKQPEEVITYAELQHILDRLDAIQKNPPTRQKPSQKEKEKMGVAFPQPSILNYRDVAYGATAAAAVLGALVGGSIQPKLWLVSGLLGGGYGYHVGTTHGNSDDPSQHFVQTLVLTAGRKLAKICLQVYDYFQTIFFMWKTGQLSYEYYKRYEVFDGKFQIQSKLDAWNRRFVQGKRNFDQWEQQNEIGRKILAGLRTAWLVEERSLRKTSDHYTSKYRLVQMLYDGSYRFGKILGRLWETLLGRNEPLREFIKGAYNNSNRRLRGIVAALLAVNLTGAAFAIFPKLLCILAILFGFVWPSWMNEFVERTSSLIDETRATGRGETHALLQTKQRPRSTVSLLWTRNSNSNKRVKYGSYKRTNGRTRYYRAGQPIWFGKQKSNKHLAKGLSWPWSNND